MIDDHSRFLVASDARVVFKAADVVATFHGAASAHGFPASLLTDNGAVFTAAPRGGGRCAIELETARLGIRSRALEPLPPADLRQGRAVPPDAEAVARQAGRRRRRSPSSRTSSTGSAPTTTRSGRTGRSGGGPPPRRSRPAQGDPALAEVRGASALPGAAGQGRHHRGRSRCATTRGCTTSGSAGLTGTRVLVLVDGLHVRVITEDGELLRELILDPSRDYQPHGRSLRWNDVPRHVGTMSRDITPCPRQESNLRPAV